MTVPGMTGDTDPNNPVNTLPPNVFPIGAAITVAYGGVDRPFCTLGNLYRILGYLTGDVPPVDGQAADPDADPPRPYIPGLADELERCRSHVAAQLPDTLRIFDPPPAPADDNAADLVWLSNVINKYGGTITLAALPGTPNNSNPTEGQQHP